MAKTGKDGKARSRGQRPTRQLRPFNTLSSQRTPTFHAETHSTSSPSQAKPSGTSEDWFYDCQKKLERLSLEVASARTHDSLSRIRIGEPSSLFDTSTGSIDVAKPDLHRTTPLDHFGQIQSTTKQPLQRSSVQHESVLGALRSGGSSDTTEQSHIFDPALALEWARRLEQAVTRKETLRFGGETPADRSSNPVAPISRLTMVNEREPARTPSSKHHAHPRPAERQPLATVSSQVQMQPQQPLRDPAGKPILQPEFGKASPLRNPLKNDNY
ncbi:hypothetical protein LTR66_015341, partial [Elasticomyces elasticus]